MPKLPFGITCGHASLATAILMSAVPSVLFSAVPSEIRFSQSADAVDVYDFMEITINVEKPSAANPFTDVIVEGQFAPDGGKAIHVDGFCDSEDGSIFRIRFMPTQAGKYSYSVKYRQDSYEETHTGSFTAVDAQRRGIVRVDTEYPWHFLWEGTGEHYFWNGTTAYWMVGLNDELVFQSLDRLADLKVNRVRAVIMGRVKDGKAWYEDVVPTDKFSFLLNPWKAERPDSVEDPGFDVTRFNVAHWQKYERLLQHARERNIVISVIFYVDGRRPGVDPFGKEKAGGEDEQRYYRYGVSRLAAYSNVMWDVTNEYRLFRDDAWAEKMGTFIRQKDPYDHLMSVHGHGDFRFRTSAWADFAMYQRWDEHGGYDYMLKNREEQAETGRIIPQVNEEYGYEDHYPAKWGEGRTAPARSADNRRRLAWGMYMAGGYQTAGERANTETGGGWINGRGDDSMIQFKGYGHIVDFFTSIPWWKLEPDNSIIQVSQDHTAKSELTHVVYTRDKNGNAALYLQGNEQAARTISGDISNWDDGFRLMLANELTQDRPWLGVFHQVAIYSRILDAEEVAQRFRAGADATPSDPQVLYTFQESDGDTIRDVSHTGESLNLKIHDIKAVKWLPNGGLEIQSPVLIASEDAAAKIIKSVKGEGAITIEAWIKPANATQSGPARIVSLSRDSGSRNFTLGQAAEAYEVRLRTTNTSANGEPSLWSHGNKVGQYICASRSKGGDLAVIYFSEGGEVTVKSGTLNKGLNAEWFNPRNGQRMDAENDSGNTYHTPDKQDWVLLFH